MTKTIRQWLEELPEPYRSQAMENYDEDFYPPSMIVFNHVEALEVAFNWEYSSQGWKYWADGRNFLKNLPLASPTNALSALHAIALKKGIAVETIMGVNWVKDNVWNYWITDSNTTFQVDLKND